MSFQQSSESDRLSPEVDEQLEDDPDSQEAVMRQQLIAKQQELLRLQQARLELELAEAEEKLKRTKRPVWCFVFISCHGISQIQTVI